MKLFDKYNIDYKFIHSCQHYRIIEKNRKKFGIKKPDVYLTKKEKDLANFREFLFWAPRVLFNARKLPIKKDDYVLVQGDAESTLLGFLIGKYFRAKIAHVEAGERSYDFFEPFPEEIIRVIVSRFSDVCFAPYQKAVDNLKEKKGVYNTHGNTAFDSARWALKFQPSQKIKKLVGLEYVLFLIHRKENLLIERRLKVIIDILEMILKKDFKVIWPVHGNTLYELERKRIWPKILKFKKKYRLETNYFFDYVDFMHAVKNSQFVTADGGGLQDETFFLNKPYLILREKIDTFSGLGETAYYCYLKKKKVKFFLNNYHQFKRKTQIKSSPSKIVVDFFRKLEKQKNICG